MLKSLVTCSGFSRLPSLNTLAQVEAIDIGSQCVPANKRLQILVNAPQVFVRVMATVQASLIGPMLQGLSKGGGTQGGDVCLAPRALSVRCDADSRGRPTDGLHALQLRAALSSIGFCSNFYMRVAAGCAAPATQAGG
jgi:hypothetical protein